MTAPNERIVEQFTGTLATDRPSKFWAALAEADEFVALEQDNIALTRRVDELTEALDEEKRHAQELFVEVLQLRAERDRMRAGLNGGC